MVEGIVVAPDYGVIYAPVDAIAAALDIPLGRLEGGGIALGGVRLQGRDQCLLPDGTPHVRLRRLVESPELEITVEWDAVPQVARARRGERGIRVRRGRRTVADGVTFAGDPKTLFIPVPELHRALELTVTPTQKEGGPTAAAIPEGVERTLPDGTNLVRLRDLDPSISVEWNEDQAAARLTRADRVLWVRRGPKRVELNLSVQRMRAWEGERLVLETPISSGRKGRRTPKGEFRAGPLKSRLVISRKFGNARMPWSVQVYRDVFIHGFTSVPPRAASHGCVRVPLTGRNPARWFYEWIPIGTPIRIADNWSAE